MLQLTYLRRNRDRWLMKAGHLKFDIGRALASFGIVLGPLSLAVTNEKNRLPFAVGFAVLFLVGVFLMLYERRTLVDFGAREIRLPVGGRIPFDEVRDLRLDQKMVPDGRHAMYWTMLHVQACGESHRIACTMREDHLRRTAADLAERVGVEVEDETLKPSARPGRRARRRSPRRRSPRSDG